MSNKFVERLNELIENSGLKKKRVAEEVGITATTLSKYITGQHEPRIDIVMRIADYFGVSAGWLLGETDEKYPDKKKAIDFNNKDQVVSMLLDFASHIEKSGLPATYIDLKKVFEEYDHIQWGDVILSDLDVRYIVRSIKGILEGD